MRYDGLFASTSRFQQMVRRKNNRRFYEQLESRRLMSFDSLFISEFVAKNNSGLADLDGAFSDWLEIHNPTESTISLTGWSLTDDANDISKWTFPSRAIGPNQFLVVFASGKNIVEGDELHANFKLSSNGEYLALASDDGQIVHEFSPSYPPQNSDQSYGFAFLNSGDVAESAGYLVASTPGEENASDSATRLDGIQFSHSGGFFDSSFMLELENPNPNASTWYTTDGSVPNSENGNLYTTPIEVASTTVIRAVADDGNAEPSVPTTRSYIFADDIITQTHASVVAAGWPQQWGDREADYELDPDVIGPPGVDLFDGVYRDSFRNSLLNLPTISLVMDQDDLFGSSGIYSNPLGRGREWERPTSVELLHPDGSQGFQIDAGIRIQGGISRQIAAKLSFRLAFRSEYGATKLNYPLFGTDGPAEFDSISLRSGSGEVIRRFHFIRDEFMRRSQIEIGDVAPTGDFAHLYLNGIYWGLYNTAERVDAQFAVSHFGGEKDDYDIYNAGNIGDEQVTATNGSMDAWNRLLELTAQVGSANSQTDKTNALLRLEGRLPNGDIDPNNEPYLDIDNLINYVALNVWGGNLDWPDRNYYMIRKRGPDSDGFQFQVWDAEFTLDGGITSARVPFQDEGALVFLPDLLTSEEFRIRFSDQVQKLFAPGGVLYVNPNSPDWDSDNPTNNEPAARYVELVEQVRLAMVAESARWGDEPAHDIDFDLFTPNEDWEPRVRRNLTRTFPNRSEMFLEDLREDDLFRDGPTFSLPEGKIESGSMLEIHSTDEIIYFTNDGSDPRSLDGSPSDSAILYDEALVINGRTLFKARSVSDGKWSAIVETVYLTDAIPANHTNLKITEINFNPHIAIPGINESNVNNERFEFVEFKNVGNEPIDLTGVNLIRRFGQGVSFEFATQILPPGQFIVVPGNAEDFQSRYGTTIDLAKGTEQFVDGYQGRIDNDGDTIRVADREGNEIQTIFFDDTAEWPFRADGKGSTLELSNDAANPHLVSSWQASDELGGTPGRINTEANGSGMHGLVDSVCSAIHFDEFEASFDLNGDGNLTQVDLDFLVNDVLRTSAGDANLDGVFDSADLIQLLANGAYEDDIRGNSRWTDGDWNCDGDLDSHDLIVAFQQSRYVG